MTTTIQDSYAYQDLEIYPGADRTSITLTIPDNCSLPCAGKVYILGLNLAKIESGQYRAETLSSCSTST